MSNTAYPAWAAPFLGAAIGAAYGFRSYGRDAPGALTSCIAIGAAIGLFAGVVLWFKVWLERREPPLGTPPSPVPWALLVVSPLLFCIPLVGAVVGGCAVYRVYRLGLANWLKNTYFVLFLVSGVFTLLFSIVWIATRLGVRW